MEPRRLPAVLDGNQLILLSVFEVGGSIEVDALLGPASAPQLLPLSDALQTRVLTVSLSAYDRYCRKSRRDQAVE